MQLPRWLRSSRIRRNGTPARPATPRARLALKPLEDRLTPSVSFAGGELTNYAELSGDTATAYTRDLADDMAADQSGNRFVLGHAYGSTAADVYHVTKLGADNSVAWVTSFVGSSYDNGGGALTVDPAGNAYAALPTWANGGAGPVEIYKINSLGAVEQSYTETRGSSDWDGGSIDIATDASGYVYYTAPGYTVKLESQASGLVKLDEYGVGGTALAVSPDGSRVYLTGRFTGVAVDFDPTRNYTDNRDILSSTSRARDTNYDAFILELERNADTGKLEFRWAGKVGGPHWDGAEDIVCDATGVYVLGTYPSSTSDTNNSTDFDPGAGRYSLPVYFGGEYLSGGMFLLKLGPDNQFQWVKGLVGNGGSGDSDHSHGRLALDAQGSVYVADAFEGTLGDFDIEHSYPGDIDRETGSPAGYSNNLFVAKYSSGGAFRWAAKAQGTNEYMKSVAGLALTTRGIHLLAGVANDTLTVSPDGTRFTASPDGGLLLLSFTQTADPVMLYVKQVYQAEGKAGTTAFTFEVYLSDPLTEPLAVSYSTAAGTATAGSDYTATSGTVYFAPGQTTATVTVLVNGDGTSETDETFALDVWSDALGGPAVRGWATIANDDTTGGKKK